jgi:eukaryotic-like serine/threonine-protein kinase
MTDRLVADRYLLGERIGSGGMGRVWLAHDNMLHRSVAVKEILFPEGLAESDLQELRLRMLREARTAARLNHPNVIRVYDVVYSDDRPWIVMEYIRSRSLAQVLKDDGPMTPPNAARVGLALLDALSEAHDAGVLHRDVKPGNVLIGSERIVLTDFGLATFDEYDTQLTQTGVVHGSPQFIAPERAQDGTSSPASDMWSLGATLYATVEGRGPYARSNSFAILQALATSYPDPPQRSGALTPVVLGLLTRDPNERMPRYEVRQRLQRIIAADDPDAAPSIPHQRSEGDVRPLPVPVAVRTARAATPVRADPALPLPRRRHSVNARGSHPRPARTPDADPWTTHRSGPANGPLMNQMGDLTVRSYERGRQRRPRRQYSSTWVIIACVLVAIIAVAGLIAAKVLVGDGSHTPGPPPPTRAAPPPTTATRAAPPPIQHGGPRPADLPWLCVPTPSPTATTVTGVAQSTGWLSYDQVGVLHVDMPTAWLLDVQTANLCAYDPHSARNLGVNWWTPKSADPVAALQQRVNEFTTAGGLPGYQTEGITAVTCPTSCADWQYTYMGPYGLMHVDVRDFLTASDQAYSISWSTLEGADWTTNLPNFEIIAGTLKPETH